MASFMDKFKVTTALDASTTMDLSCQHITTSDWMQGSPIYIKECVPGEKLQVNVETFTRLAPMAVPTFGRGLIHNRAFFVPMRTIFTNWNDFITSANDSVPVVGTSSATTTVVQTSTVPLVYNSSLARLFTLSSTATTNFDYGSNSFATVVTGTPATNHDCDIVLTLYGTGATDTYDICFNLTSIGRRVMKILQSLGYNILWYLPYTNTSPTTVDYDDAYSALPLLSWLKIILDWYYPSAYVGDDTYRFIDSLIHAHADGSGAHEVTIAELRKIFADSNLQSGMSPQTGLMCYDSDYFVSAFDYPTGSAAGMMSGNYALMGDINFEASSLGSTVTSTAAGQIGILNGSNSIGDVPVYGPKGVSSGGKVITQYGLDALKALSDYCKRHQLVGARALDRYYARFGKSLSSEKLDRCNYIGAQNVPLQFGDVMSHSNTYDSSTSGGTLLGNYAGKGIGYSNDGNFEFSTDEYGYFVVVSSIIPTTGFYQGIDRNVLHKGRLDFFTPEMDQLGNQAIAKKELFLPMNAYDCDLIQDAGSMNNPTLNKGIFGYAPRYAEYKCGRDRLTGDYRLKTKRIGDTSDSWHLMRNVDDLYQQSSDIAHTKYFVMGADSAQYNRVFNVKLTTSDKFYLIHNFNVKSTAPMHSLYDSYEFKNEDDSKKVIADVNGVKVN